MENEQLTSEQSLRIIEAMINSAKNQFGQNGHLYLLWGWLVLTCSLAQFVLAHFVQVSWNWVVWLSVWVAMIYQYFYIRHTHRERRVRTYTDSILGTVWLAFAIVIVLLAAVIGNIFMAQGIEFFSIANVFFLLLYGIPTFVSGFVLKFRPLWIGAIGCWVLAVVAPFVHDDFRLLTLAPAMLVGWIIPGYMLRARYKRTVSHGL